jgi:hypothetical protein
MTTDKNPHADQATHGSGKRNSDRTSSDAHRLEEPRPDASRECPDLGVVGPDGINVVATCNRNAVLDAAAEARPGVSSHCFATIGLDRA